MYVVIFFCLGSLFRRLGLDFESLEMEGVGVSGDSGGDGVLVEEEGFKD
jgi:hypothetical protein